MLYLDNLDTILGVDVFGDHDPKEFNKFYLIPQQPRFRVDENGFPIFKFIKYKFPIDRKDGRKGGGYVVFDVEFTVPDDVLANIKKELQTRVNEEAKKRKINPAPPVKIASVNYTKGTSRLNIMKADGALVERVFDAGKPSLYGKNISTYSIELTPEGATFFAAAMQGQGGFVSVVYELEHEVRLPPVSGVATWNARSFYLYVQQINVTERLCSADDYKETLMEINNRSESRLIEINPGSADVDPKVITEIRNMMTRALDDAVERSMIKALPVENPEEARKWYKENDIENVRKEVMRSQSASFSFNYREETIVQRGINPQGVLPNITTLVDKNKKPIKWSDYYVEIDLDDPFFQQVNVDVHVEANFATLPINSVEVKLLYNGKPMSVIGKDTKGEARFASPDDKARFASFMVDGNKNYKYSYQVNYKGYNKIYQSPVFEQDDASISLGVDDIGLINVNLLPGDINFEEVKQVQITMRYEDKDKNVKMFEQQFIMSPQAQSHYFQKVIFTEFDKPYQYNCRYFMKDGREFTTGWVEGTSPILHINDPFVGKKSINVIAAGDLEEDIQTIFLDLKYLDTVNKYEQATSVALNQDNPNFIWEFPIISESTDAKVTYQGNIAYRKGTTEAIPETTAVSPTIIINPIQDMFEVTVSALLLDFSEVKMVRVQLRYNDPKNKVVERKDLSFTEDKDMEQFWKIKLKDLTLNTYEWGATFFMQDGSKKTLPMTPSDTLSIDLELPM